MLRLLTRFWSLAFLLAFVLGVTLMQPVPPATASGSTDPLDLPPLAAPALEPLEASAPVGEFIPEPEVTPGDEAVPFEPSLPDVASGSIDFDSLEVTERREYSTVFETPDGATVERLSMEPLNAEVDGEWVAIDTEIQSASSGWAVETHPLAPEFADRADSSAAVTLSRYGHELSFTLVGAGEGAVQAPFWWWDDWDTIGYDDVMPGVDLEYEVTNGAVKESVVLQDVPETGDNSWSWRIRPGSLTPQLLEDDSLVFLNPAGDAVMSVPTPIAWDSSQTDEHWRAETPLEVELVQTGASIWRFTLTVDEDWLTDDDRVYPVTIDPTFEAGPAARNSYKSDGFSQSGILNTGNPNQAGGTVLWRSIPTFDYGSIPGRTIANAQMGVGFVAGQTQSQTGVVSHACAFNFTCSGTDVTSYTLGTGWTETTGTAMAQYLVNRFRVGDRPAFMLRGSENSGWYTYKQVEADLWIVYYDKPTISLSTPAANATTGFAPTFRVNTTNPTGQPQGVRYQVSRNSSFTDIVVDTGVLAGTTWNSSVGMWRPDTDYWWRASVEDGLNGHLGQSTVSWSDVRRFHTNQVPMPELGSASPGTAIGVAENPGATATAQTVTTLTPRLSVNQVLDTDALGGHLRFRFRIATGLDGRTGAVAVSQWMEEQPNGSPVTWDVPAGMLQDGAVYSWTVDANDGVDTSTYNTWVSRFRVDLRLGTSGPSPFDSAGPVTVNLANGNAALSFASPTVQTVGGPMGFSFSYNSQETPNANRGLRGQYYRAPHGATNPADFTFTSTSTELLLTRNDPAVHFNWGSSAPADSLPADGFMARWTGFITAPPQLQNQPLRFGIRQDDGARFRIGDGGCTNWTVNNWTPTSATTTWAPDNRRVTLTNTVPICVEYFERNNDAVAELWVQEPSGNSYVVPSDWFSRSISVLPAGWASSMPIAGDASAWVSAAVNESSVVLTDATGKAHTYLRVSGGGFKPPTGEFGTVSLDSAGRVVFTDDSGTVYTFGADGRVATSTPPTDARRSATPLARRDSNGLVTSIVDPVSQSGSNYLRQITLTYQNADRNACPSPAGSSYSVAPQNMLCRLTYPDGAETRLYYNANGQLASIIDPGNEITRFGYDGTGALAQIVDSVANDALIISGAAETYAMSTQIEYSTCELGTPNKRPCVTRVTMPAPDGTTNTHRAWRAFTYAAGTTTITASGSTGPVGQVTYDTAWRTTSATTAMGVTSSQQWHPTRDLVQRSTDQSGRVNTTVYDPVTDRPIHTYGPAPAACFTAAGTPVPDPVAASGCGIVPAHSSTQYDGGMNSLQAAFYTNTTLQGAPSVVQLGINGANGAIGFNWGANAPVPGIAADNWSLRLTGLVTFPNAGNYRFSALADDAVRVWVNDVLVVDGWAAGTGWRSGELVAVAAGDTRRIRVEYMEGVGNAALQLNWTPPGASTSVVIPGSALRPDYGLATQVSASDSTPPGLTAGSAPTTTTTSTYQHPWLGAATSSRLDPGGANLETRVTYEQPGGTGWLRRIARTPPAGTLPGAPTSAAHTSAYYGNLENGPAVCGLPAGTPQFGALASSTGPTPASGAAVASRAVYDVWGRIIATRSADDTDWSCTTYDARGRITRVISVGGPGVTSVEQTVAYTPTPTGLIVVRTRGQAAITAETSLTGTLLSYEDALGAVTEPQIDPLSGRLTSSATTIPGGQTQITAFTYDADGKLLTLAVDGVVYATVTYNARREVASVVYRDGASLDAVIRDGAGALTSQNWTLPGGSTLIDSVLRSQAGRVLQHVIGDGTAAFTSTYRYDGAGRLVGATLPGHDLTYQYAASAGCGPNTTAGASGNRTGLVDVWTAPGAAPLTTTTSYCYDWADRLLSANVANPVPNANAIADGVAAAEIRYDASGDITQLADATFTYDALGLHSATTWADGTTVSVQRDSTGRIITSSTDPGGDEVVETTSYLHSGDGDVPYMRLSDGGATRPLALPGGAMVSVGAAGNTWSFPSILGHGAVTSDGLTSSGVRLYDPFGQPLDSSTLSIGSLPTAGVGLEGGVSGWHQAAQKLTDDSGSYHLMQMGERLYVPALGRFLQVDPVEGGNPNDYVWPLDPIGESDLDGRCSYCSPGTNPNPPPVVGCGSSYNPCGAPPISEWARTVTRWIFIAAGVALVAVFAWALLPAGVAWTGVSVTVEGTAIRAVPMLARSTPSLRGGGRIYSVSPRAGLHRNVTSFRTGAPNRYTTYRYGVFQNQQGQGVHPFTGRTIPNNHEYRHLPTRMRPW